MCPLDTARRVSMRQDLTKLLPDSGVLVSFADWQMTSWAFHMATSEALEQLVFLGH